MQMLITMDPAFLTDLSLSDLLDGEYSVLGKVVRSIPLGSEESINLLRKTSLGRLQTSRMEQMLSGFQGLQQQGFDITQIATRIIGTGLQVISIAVFV